MKYIVLTNSFNLVQCFEILLLITEIEMGKKNRYIQTNRQTIKEDRQEDKIQDR